MLNRNYTLMDLATANYIDSKGKALGGLDCVGANSVFTTTNNTLYVATATADGDIKFSEYKIPTGNRVLDSIELVENLATAIEYSNYKALNHRISVLEDKNDTDVSIEDTNTIELLRITRDYIYPKQPTQPDKISALITLAMLSNSIYNLSSNDTKSILSTITDNKRDDFNKTVTNIIQTRECDYIKNTCCDLNKAKFDNIRNLATATTRKWNKRGITKSTLKDKEIIRQVLLTVFESEYKLAITKKESKKVEFII